MNTRSVGRALRRFGFRQTIRGALIIGVLGGIMMGAYGSAIAEVYPTQASRDLLVKTLSATPAINFLSGEVKNASQPASYAIYKSLPMMTLITAVWGLMVATRLLRGNEEDGRLELIVSGATTKRRTAAHLLLGFGYSIIVAIVVMWALAAALGQAPHVELSALEAFYMTLAVFMPGLVFAGIGVLMSQLTLTRGRAVLYGLLPLIVLYCVRGAANTSDKLDWLKAFSLFGWSDFMNAVLSPHPEWVIPGVICLGIFTAVGLYWAGTRDYGTSLLPQPDEVRSHLRLLGSTFAFTVRQKRSAFVWWLVGVLALVSFMTALAGMVTNILQDSGSALQAFAVMSSDQVKLLFIGLNFMILGLVLLALVTIEVGSIRRDEAKLYLDNLLVQPVRRSAWILQRIAIVLGMSVLIALIAVMVTWWIADVQHIDISLGNALASGVGVMSSIVLVVGVGIFLYGWLPRLAVAGMSLVIGWAFVVDIVRKIFQLEDWVEKTSVLYYIPVDPSKAPEWGGVAWLFAIGIALGALGIWRFMKRDITQE